GLVSASAVTSSSEEATAIAFASGDFNGDGIADMAATIAATTSSMVCFWFGSRDSFMVQGPCARSLPGDSRFGADITAADLEGDGVDELIVTAVNGGKDNLRVVSLDDASALVAPIGPPGVGLRLTTIWPGRPGKARWAAIGAGGRAVAIFEGSEIRQTLKAPDFVQQLGTGLR
ncbi:MAG: VCBS repeat-containing protein, partial [Labilithrix sp.]|nr:VCBS repeat-containing protein [Labilithrix sp.]